MNCKSCNSPLPNSAKYCSNCGAKITHGRLSLKGTWEEFIGPFLSWDNNFWRTFIDLFTRPKLVLEAYISGARKKYFQPFSYIILYATIAVLFYKFFPMGDPKDYSEAFNNGFNANNPTTKVPEFDINGYMNSVMNYYNFIILMFLPVYAFTSYFVYKKRKHNFFEHLVFNSYIQANFGFVSLILQLLLVNIIGVSFMTYTVLFMAIMIFFTIYIFKKLYSESFKQSIFSFTKYILLFSILYIVVILMISIIFGMVLLFSKL